MSYLLDTNIISEVRKGERCYAMVASWYASVEEGDLFLSALVLGEIRKGCERLRSRDTERAARLVNWLEQVKTAFGARILAVDGAVADRWGRMNAMRTVPAIDGLLAATAFVHGLTLVTRNEADVFGLGAKVFNPFRSSA